MCQLQAPGQLLLFSLTQCARPSSIRASSVSPTPKVDELPEGGIKGIECWDILSTSQYMVNILAISQKANTWCLQQARTKPDCALTNLAFRFCAAFICASLALKAWHTPSREGCRLEAPNTHSTQTRSYLAQLLPSLLELGKLSLQHLPTLAITGHHRSMMDSAAWTQNMLKES